MVKIADVVKIVVEVNFVKIKFVEVVKTMSRPWKRTWSSGCSCCTRSERCSSTWLSKIGEGS